MARPEAVARGRKKRSNASRSNTSFEAGLLLRFRLQRYKTHTTISVSFRRPDFSWLKDFLRDHAVVVQQVSALILLVIGVTGILTVSTPNAPVRFTATTAAISSAPTNVKASPVIEKPYVLKRSVPSLLEIPAIEVSVDVAQTTLDANGELAVPASSTISAWYAHSPTPGELGPSVIVGHLNSVVGDAVFAKLHTLAVGSDIWVSRADGSRLHFRVERVSHYSQNQFPTQEVYGPIDHAGLRLVTCGGSYNYLTGRYSENTVVFARLVQ